MIEILIWPVLLSLLLVLIHVYFGREIVRQGILFLDLAMAQWAALGYLAGHWMHVEHPALLFGLSFGFTIVSATVLAGLRKLFKELNFQEASVGVMYVLAAVLGMTLVSAVGLEPSLTDEMLMGHLMFVLPKDVALAALIYAIAGGIHYALNRFGAFFGHWREWLFLVSFGLVVTSSVKLAGVLLVFSFLVVPVFTVSLLTSRRHLQLWGGWALGIVGTLSGVLLSVWVDLPVSFGVILMLCALLILGILFRWKQVV